MNKFLCVALLASCAAAHAGNVDLIAVSPNNAGGSIMIYGVPCTDNKNGAVVMATDAGGEILLQGCATPIANATQIYVRWEGGRSSVFPTSGFTWAPTKK